MDKLAYAVYDIQGAQLHMFSADANLLAKDVIASFLSEKVIPHTFADGLEGNAAKDFLTVMSASSDIDELKQALIVYDFEMAVMPI